MTNSTKALTEPPDDRTYRDLLEINSTQVRRLAELTLMRAAFEEEKSTHARLKSQVDSLAELLDQFLTLYPTSAFSGKNPASQILIEVRKRVHQLKEKR